MTGRRIIPQKVENMKLKGSSRFAENIFSKNGLPAGTNQLGNPLKHGPNTYLEWELNKKKEDGREGMDESANGLVRFSRRVVA